MSETAENPRAVTGNNAPAVEELFRELNADLPTQLQRDCGEVLERADALVKNSMDVPTVITSEEEEAKATDIVSQMKKHWKLADSRRLGIGALPRMAQSIINNFFTDGALDPLTKGVDRIEPGVSKWKRIKAEKERREREEAEQRAREEAERQRKLAEEAQRKQREAEAARQRAVDEQRRAEAAAAKAKQEAAEAEVRRQQAEQRRKEAEAAAAEAETKRKKAAAERQRREAEEAAARASREREAADERAKAEREKAKEAKTEVALSKGDLSDASKEVRTQTALAKHADADAGRASRAANAKLSTISGIRGDHGGQSSLSTRMVGTIVDRDKLDKVKLWPFIKDEHLQAALDAYVRVHKDKRPLNGAVIAEESATAFR